MDAPPTTQTSPDGWPRPLLDAFRAGRREALTEVYQLHAPDLARLLRLGFTFEAGGRAHRFVGYAGAFELQDALQETFRRAFEEGARLRYDGLRPYGPYLFAISRNVVLRTFRAREVLFPTTGEMALVSAEPDGRSSPENALHREQVRRLVSRFLETLGADDRRLLSLRFIDGVAQRDAAEQLGIGRQRLRSREDKLRERLVIHLRAHGASAGPAADLALIVFALGGGA